MRRLIPLVLALLAPASAAACGGLFCNQAQPVAVDQVREQVLFEVNADGTVTSTVGIRFEGDSESFSWVIPVPDQPELDVVPASGLELLDNATQPRIIPPSYFPNWGDDDDAADDDDATSGDDDDINLPPVVVEDLPQVGPFEPQWITSEDPGALVAWLNDNGYLITPAMEPFVADYVASDMGFLGLKLAPDSIVTDIAPISLTYAGQVPALPIKLTSVSTAPMLELEIFVAGRTRFASGNYATVTIDRDDIRMDPRDNRTNYFELAAWRVAQLGGQAVVTELALPSAQARDLVDQQFHPFQDEADARLWLRTVLSRHDFLTRFTSRLENTAMTIDPTFVPAGGANIDRLRDLRNQDDFTDNTGYAPCGTSFCGTGQCAARQGGYEGCLCRDGYTARAADRPGAPGMGGGQRIACVDASFNLLAGVQADGPGACDFTTCENGTCEVVGGFATCRCDRGRAAFPTADGMICLTPDATFGAEQLLWGETLDEWWPDGGLRHPGNLFDPGAPTTRTGVYGELPSLPGCADTDTTSGIENLQEDDGSLRASGCSGTAAALLLLLPLGALRRRAA